MARSSSFDEDRNSAAGLFAQTMIVVDDEASQTDLEKRDLPVSNLRTPRRGATPIKSEETSISAATSTIRANALNAKKLIEKALELGIICSVLRVTKDTDPANRIVNAARNADLVSLDWEIENDGGELARTVISRIVASDEKQNGRVRLIAVYTSMRNRTEILKLIKERLRDDHGDGYQLTSDCISNKGRLGAASLRIICLLKADGIKKILPAQKEHEVVEQDLPERLLREFSLLSEGILGNVAMATIASVRAVTHHVLQVFDERMDGPYFHHRATITKPYEAEDYAIDLVLSEIKKSVIRKSITPFVDKPAVERSIDAKCKGKDKTLRYRKQGNDNDIEARFSPNQIKDLITEGVEWFAANGKSNGIENFNKKGTKNEVTTLFEASYDSARVQMARFASMSQLGFQPEGHRVKCGDFGPNLTTGTILRYPSKGKVLICLQATCDTVRRPKSSSFIFAPLEPVLEKRDRPVFVLPIENEDGGPYTMYSMRAEAYSDLIPIRFDADEDLQLVRARKSQGRSGFHFFGSDGKAYKWLGNAKIKRALRAVNSIAQDMSRIGFDEFEPFRVP